MAPLAYWMQANLLLLMGVGAYYVLLRRETYFGLNRLLLWALVGVALVMPLVELPDWRPQPVQRVMQRAAHVAARLPRTPPDVIMTYPDGRSYRAFAQTPQSNGVPYSWPNVLGGLYTLVTLALLGRMGLQLASLRRLIRRGRAVPYDAFTLIESPAVAAPFSFFHYVVLNPARHAPAELDCILRHERVHVRQRHSLDVLAAELLCVALWFNPAAWVFRRLLHQTLEFMADRAVLAEGVDATTYQYSLVNVSLSTDIGRSAVTTSFGASSVRVRLGMMRAVQPRPFHYVLFAGLLGWLAACTGPTGQPDGPYVYGWPNGVACVITADQSAKELTELARKMARHGVSLRISNVVRRPDGALQRLQVGLAVAGSGDLISFTTGSPYGRARLEPIGIQCRGGACQAGLVDQTFPEPLRSYGRPAYQRPASGRAATSGLRAVVVTTPGNPNQRYGVFDEYYLNDFIESNYFGYRRTLLRIAPDRHLDLYDEFADAAVFLDGQPIDRAALRQIHVRDLKKFAVFRGDAAAQRLGRPVSGLVLIQKRRNRYVRDHYVLSDYYDMTNVVEADGHVPLRALDDYRQSVLNP